MLAMGSFTLEEFVAGIERFRRMRWITTLRAIGPLGDGRSQSPGESVLRLRWIESRLPTPHPQLRVWSDGVLLGILDMANEELRYAAEYDGKEWHTSDQQVAHDAARRGIIANEGWLIDAFVSEDLYGPQANPELRLRYGAAEASRRFGRRAG